ncbi:hypothetical protein GP5015_1747 [gamma proteobacterium HTCC5015]|nr:hypothetical protein GP5015_1747 [gamma proteobacterium HTCC5015]
MCKASKNAEMRLYRHNPTNNARFLRVFCVFYIFTVKVI